MKIGTLTYHRANNYGAVLQAFALQKYILDSGIETEIIDFELNKKTTARKDSLGRKIWRYLSEPHDYLMAKIKQKKFEEFRQKHLVISSDRFFGDQHISQSPPDYDMFVVGSDQVWNTDISNGSSAFFLDFVKEGRKVSYAASLGKNEPNKMEMSLFSQNLRTFDALSVREKALKAILEVRFSIKAEHVLDPIFLLRRDAWAEIASEIALPKNYVLCYLMEPAHELVRFSKTMAKQQGWETVFLSLSDSVTEGRKLKGLGPSEFIHLLLNADYICTNSFHGTAFSLIFEKNFTVFPHSRLNSRISSLLGSVGLENRLLGSSQFQYDEVNFKEVNNRLGPLVRISKEFLAQQISYKK